MVFQGSLAELRERQNRQLRIGIRGTDKALDLLRSAGRDVCTDGLDFISIRGVTIDASQIVRMLVQDGNEVFHASLHQDSLEDIFLSLTGGGKQ
jgi:hypothetical protein